MNDDAPCAGQALEEYREFLVCLAWVQIDPRLQGKLDAEGIVQETLLRAHKARDQFCGETCGKMKAWLRSIFMRALLDELATVPPGRSLDAAIADSSVRLKAFLESEGTSPSEQAMRNERALQLESALAELPDRQREAVVLKHIHGWSLAEISVHLGVNASAVAGLLHRGLTKLGERLPKPE
jgi:RNA polymerase sigma-70 factor (ECF subfamily)